MKTFISASNVFDIDWYGRDTLPVAGDTQYSSFIINEETASKLVDGKPLHDRVKLGWFLSKCVKHLYRNRNCLVYINEKSDESYTDGRDIMVSAAAGDKNSAPNAKIDTYIGLALHESCHCRYSDFTALLGANMNKAEKWINNVIEDEAIENTLRNERSGYGKFIDVIKATQLNSDDFDYNTDDERTNIMNMFFTLVRLPHVIREKITEEQKAKYGELFYNIYNIMKNNNCLIEPTNESRKSCTRTNINAAILIWGLISDFCGAGKNDTPDHMPDTNYSGDNNESDNNGEREDVGDIMSELKQKDGAELKDLLDGNISLSDDMKATSEKINKVFKCDDFHKANERCAANASKFALYKNAIHQYINKAVKMFSVTDDRINYGTQRNSLFGQIDDTFIASAAAGNRFCNKRIAERKVKTNKKLAVVLMCDMSGSMSMGKAADKAGLMVTLFAEAINKLSGCELYIYTHNNTLKNVCVNDYNKNKFNIGWINCDNAMGNQDECMAYETAVKETRKHTDLPILIINFTDSAYGFEYRYIKETVNNIYKDYNARTTLVCVNDDNRCEKDNIKIYGENNYVNMGGLTVCSINALINKMSKIIREMYK